MARINLRNTTVTFLDADESNSITFGPGPGDISVSNLAAWDNEEPLEATNRTAHDGFATGNKLRQEVTGTLEVDGKFTATDAARLLDWVRRTGQYDPDTGSVSLTSVDSCFWCFKVKVSSTVCGITTGFELPKVRLMGNFTEGDPASTVALTGTNYVQPTFF